MKFQTQKFTTPVSKDASAVGDQETLVLPKFAQTPDITTSGSAVETKFTAPALTIVKREFLEGQRKSPRSVKGAESRPMSQRVNGQVAQLAECVLKIDGFIKSNLTFVSENMKNPALREVVEVISKNPSAAKAALIIMQAAETGKLPQSISLNSITAQARTKVITFAQEFKEASARLKASQAEMLTKNTRVAIQNLGLDIEEAHHVLPRLMPILGALKDGPERMSLKSFFKTKEAVGEILKGLVGA